ncbi:MAG: 16S rRNA (adenine(1518)-N(6)/adenine(1519)-N(6))-dimethyltransferase RsmA [Betaproteobacteria bacterium]|nr:16S rRNA (adenine(1518)-N(6)/adenine(1519)-N(6))-dimethyltransferase RsmA [Betaproteobacteria bacterium]MBI2509687.1 16S rRNA (adenine(1518)-N(6)/adenine(1519)-N(6))-dimethyltransferase RsmA [Betaproteobacteria bacterium]
MRHRPRKRFGQNFLVDESVVAAIVAAVAPQPGDRVVEIGPGLGALTRPLSAQVNHLHVIEIDRDIVKRLEATLPRERVTIYAGDALKFDFSTLGRGLRVVGNLPYNISTPLLFHLAGHAAAIRDIHVMLQKEVVERMVAHPSDSDYGRLSVMLQYRFRMERVLEVPSAAFHPVPKVESAVVRMAPFAQPPHPARDEALFAAIVAAAFAQRRKTLRNALRQHFGTEDFRRLGVDAGLRAQDLSVEDFVRLADHAAVRAKRA